MALYLKLEQQPLTVLQRLLRAFLVVVAAAMVLENIAFSANRHCLGVDCRVATHNWPKEKRVVRWLGNICGVKVSRGSR